LATSLDPYIFLNSEPGLCLYQCYYQGSISTSKRSLPKCALKDIDRMVENNKEETNTGLPGCPPNAFPMREKDKMNQLPSTEEHFPEYLPGRPGLLPEADKTSKQSTRRFWIFSLSSYSIFHTTNAARLRHVAMITIILIRTAMSALSILSAALQGNVADIVVYSLVAIATLWFTATCLAIIGDTAGDKQIQRRFLVSFILFLYF
jgi:hypothetical protein